MVDPSVDWRDDALCRQVDPRLFDPLDSKEKSERLRARKQAAA